MQQTLLDEIEMSPFHIILAIAVMAAWGVNFVVIKIGLESFPPILLSTLRFGLAGLPLVFLWKSRPAPLIWIVAIALSLGVFKFSFLFIGINLGAGPGLSSLVLQLQAFFTILFAFFLLGERPSKRQMTGTVLAFTGLSFIVIEVYGEQSAFVGILFVIIGAIFWGLNNIAMKKAQSTNPLHLMIWVSAFCSPILFALSWVFEGSEAILVSVESVSTSGVLSVLYLAVVATLAGFGIWAYLLKTYDAGLVAPFSLLVPVFGMSSSAFFLGEPITNTTLIAALFIFSGLYLNSVKPGYFERKAKPC